MPTLRMNRDAVLQNALACMRELKADWQNNSSDGSWNPLRFDKVISDFAALVERETAPVFLHDTPNQLDRIEHIWCWISTDETGEGVCAAPVLGAGSIVPLIAADEVRLDSIRQWAEAIARSGTKPVKLIKLSLREDLEEIPCG